MLMKPHQCNFDEMAYGTAHCCVPAIAASQPHVLLRVARRWGPLQWRSPFPHQSDEWQKGGSCRMHRNMFCLCYGPTIQGLYLGVTACAAVCSEICIGIYLPVSLLQRSPSPSVISARCSAGGNAAAAQAGLWCAGVYWRRGCGIVAACFVHNVSARLRKRLAYRDETNVIVFGWPTM